MMQHKNTSFWTSNMGFTLACIGAAVGLGNIWKFPYMTGTQGGGAFVFVYLVTIFAIAIPVAAAELLVGRKGRSDAVSSVRDIALENNRPAAFGVIGGIGVFGSFVLLTFYAVIAGWVSSYIWRALSGQIGGLDAAGAEAMFGVILIRKLAAGLERANLILMPSLVIMLVFIAVYGAIAGDIKASLAYMFTPDFSKITPEVIQSAVGQGFFSVGVGAAMLMTYGAYLDKSINLGQAAITIALADTAIAILAGIGIFAIVFGQSLDPSAGPGLIFTTLPLAFAQLPFGGPLALIFFLLVYFAALTSGLSLAEVMFRWAENRFGWSRKRAIAVMLGASFLVGLCTVFSFNIWSDVTVAGRTMFDLKDYLVTAYIMPLGGLGVILFAAWVMPVATLKQAFGGDGILFSAWLFAGRFLAPLGILWIFWAGL
jgi:NSS family neurotransmitter:Na+ symporter